ncbi:MAG: lysozyme [Bacteroides sp.]|nr:lysozyme [Bacteroides sp.]
MKKLSTLLLVLLAFALPLLTCLPGYGNAGKTAERQVENVSSFEQAVRIIKKYEGLHSPKHWPLVGYGHLVMPGEKFSRSKTMSEKEAEALLRKDLLKNCAVFREFGKDSLLLGVLAYNIGSGATLKSSVVKKLKSGNRDIKSNYLAHSRYKGKTLSGLKKRRIEEFEALFIDENDKEIIEVETEQDTTLMAEAESQNQEMGDEANSLFASVFSPVRLMLGALSNPFRMATLGGPIEANLNVSLKNSVTKLLCESSI